MLLAYIKETRYMAQREYNLLKWTLIPAATAGRFARWRLRLSEFDFGGAHRAGIKHRAADALFHVTTTGEEKHP